eukprot:PhF_6_TR33615/c0_g1_i1/m.49093
MGKGRDKQKKRDKNDPDKQARKREKQLHKEEKHAKREQRKQDRDNDDEEDIEKLVAKMHVHATGTISIAEIVQAPSERVNASFFQHPLRETQILLFGGEFWNGAKTITYNDLFYYNIPKKEWKLLGIHGAMPQPRSSHAFCVYKNFVIVYGGEFTSPTQNSFHHYKDTWRLHCQESTYVWEEMKHMKSCPPARSGHRMALWKKQAVMFGGFFDTTAELRYYDDIWIMSNLDTVPQWNEIEIPRGAERPPPRSGHCMAVQGDLLYVYGGYTSERDATGHTTSRCHTDLWELNLLTQHWVQVKKAGIPPAVRSGMSMVFRSGKAYLFGGVFDGDEGDKMRSKFYNDLFLLNLESKRFFPMTLRKKKVRAVAKEDTGGVDADLLANLPPGADDDDDEDLDDDAPQPPPQNPTAENPSRFTHYEVAPGVFAPCPRFNTMMCVIGPNLYLFGGQVEEGNREITFSDMFVLNLNRMDTYEPLMTMDITQQPWYDADGDWETQYSSMTSQAGGRAQTEGDDNDESGSDSRSDLSSQSSDDDAEEAPALVPANEEAKPKLTASALATSQPQSRGSRGARGSATTSADNQPQVKTRLEELEKLLQESDDGAPIPRDGENARSYFNRTREFWENTVRMHNEETGSKMKGDGFGFARRRFDECLPILDQIAYLRTEMELARKKEERKKLATQE